MTKLLHDNESNVSKVMSLNCVKRNDGIQLYDVILDSLKSLSAKREQEYNLTSHASHCVFQHGMSKSLH